MKRAAVVSDTSAEAEEVLLRLAREAPPWRKLELMEQWSRSLRLLALAELRRHHPAKGAVELRILLAERLYGAEIARWISERPVD